MIESKRIQGDRRRAGAPLWAGSYPVYESLWEISHCRWRSAGPHQVLMYSRMATIWPSLSRSPNAGIRDCAKSLPLAMRSTSRSSAWCQVWPLESCGGGGYDPSSLGVRQFGTPSPEMPWQAAQYSSYNGRPTSTSAESRAGVPDSDPTGVSDPSAHAAIPNSTAIARSNGSQPRSNRRAILSLPARIRVMDIELMATDWPTGVARVSGFGPEGSS